jgi:hypothetical protein
MSAKQLLIERHQKRGYYAGLMRTACIALISKNSEIFPWESDEWKQNMPELSAFLSNPESEYGGTQEDYNLLMQQFSLLANEYKWLNKYFHEFAEKDQSKHLPPKPLNTKKIGIFIVILSIGVLVGGLLF